jgi:hypothetical protein
MDRKTVWAIIYYLGDVFDHESGAIFVDFVHVTRRRRQSVWSAVEWLTPFSIESFFACVMNRDPTADLTGRRGRFQ